MAGGGGTRFWPLSRKKRPKQLLNLSGNGLMINETLERLSKSVEWENMFIVTNTSQEELMKEETKRRFPREHILVEPAARNTSACIGYAAMEIVRKYGDGIMCVLPSDHFIKDGRVCQGTGDGGVDGRTDRRPGYHWNRADFCGNRIWIY